MHIIRNGDDLGAFVAECKRHKYPYTLTLDDKKKRTLNQNALQHKWHQEAAEQLRDESAEDKRAYCKLHFGVPILRGEVEEFRLQYDRVIRPLAYPDKLELMKVPIDFPVTRLMTTGQHARYLDDVYDHYRALGVQLTEP